MPGTPQNLCLPWLITSPGYRGRRHGRRGGDSRRSDVCLSCSHCLAHATSHVALPLDNVQAVIPQAGRPLVASCPSAEPPPPPRGCHSPMIRPACPPRPCPP